MKRIIQIAGIKDLQEARMLLTEGVDWLGFPFHLPVNEEDLTIAQAADVITQVDPNSCVLITYLKRAEEILSCVRVLGVKKVQLHGDITAKELVQLKQTDPALFVIKSIIVGKKNIAELRRDIFTFDQHVDAFLTDTYDPVTTASGATGKSHDWKISRELASVSSRPLILAGGLNAENIEEAIATVQPYGVDAHTGVEDETGRKSPAKVRAFVAAARRAFGA